MFGRRPGRGSGDDSAIGCALTLMLCVFFMPIVGVVLLVRDNQDKKALGLVMLIGGIILWTIVGIASLS